MSSRISSTAGWSSSSSFELMFQVWYPQNYSFESNSDFPRAYPVAWFGRIDSCFWLQRGIRFAHRSWCWIRHLLPEGCAEDEDFQFSRAVFGDPTFSEIVKNRLHLYYDRLYSEHQWKALRLQQLAAFPQLSQYLVQHRIARTLHQNPPRGCFRWQWRRCLKGPCR